MPWRRPGFQLGLDIAAIHAANPQAIGCILGGHGITAWGDTSDACEARSLDIIRTAERFIAEHRLNADQAQKHFDAEAKVVLDIVNPYLRVIADVIRITPAQARRRIRDTGAVIHGVVPIDQLPLPARNVIA